jgi:hypothetical protein
LVDWIYLLGFLVIKRKRRTFPEWKFGRIVI